MASILTHPVVPVALSSFLPRGLASPALLLAGAICSIIPDLDVIGFSVGISYANMFGHRGFTHSIFFAAALAAMLSLTIFRSDRRVTWITFLFLLASTLSHTLLDMLTNGGLGVALFAPFSNERYFFPWRPLVVSPIEIESFFSRWGARVIASELRWIWMPSVFVFAVGYAIRRYNSTV